jgi:hypothetical protein
MTLQEIQVVFQAISSLAIAGGLVFTGIQFRLGRKAQHVANFSKMVELQMQLRKMRVEHPHLARVHAHDTHGLDSDEEIQHYFLNLMQASVFEIVWYSHRQGQLPDDYFHSWASRMKHIVEEDSFRRAMKKSSMKIFHDEFERYLNEELARINASGTNIKPSK